MANDLFGALFKVDKPKSEAAPKYDGRCQIGGKEWRIAGWIRNDKNGKPYISLKFSEPTAPAKAKQPEPAGGADDSIPF